MRVKGGQLRFMWAVIQLHIDGVNADAFSGSVSSLTSTTFSSRENFLDYIGRSFSCLKIYFSA